jgi:RNA polymerase sigma factor (TIGR02999 family)
MLVTHHRELESFIIAGLVTIRRHGTPIFKMRMSSFCCSAACEAPVRNRGHDQIRDQMLPLVYDELRRLARLYLARERSDHTLQPTALVHEAYLRLVDQRQVDWTNRAQFVGMAAVMMRRVLVNHARDRAADKRGGEAVKVSLSLADGIDESAPVDVIALHEALDALEAIDVRKSRIVELKFFGGLTIAEVAETLQLSATTVEREWRFSRAWLFDVLTGGVA